MTTFSSVREHEILDHRFKQLAIYYAKKVYGLAKIYTMSNGKELVLAK